MEGSKRNIPVKMGDFSIIDTEFSSIRERFDAEMRKMEDEMNKFRSELISREMPVAQSSITSRTRTSEYHRSVDGKEEERQRETSELFSRSSRAEPAAVPRPAPARAPTEANRAPTEANRAATEAGRAPTEAGRAAPARVTTEVTVKHTSSTKEAPNKAGSGIRRSSSSTTQNSSGFPGTCLAPRSDPTTWLDSLNSPLIQDEGDQKQLKLRFDVSQYKPEEIVVKTVDNKLLVHAKHEEKTDGRSVYREYNREFLLPQGSNPEMIKSSLSKDGILTVEAPLPALEGSGGHIPIAHH
ncbi:uncharacterized protein LOC119107106 isoform X1 [Pollicipes pollicipes]|uniref:uncharacterized protein LOC119107106 isoform X1 n=1 Tax=Pollicipes pollicipes TaxID=41117 RepID=UPI001884F833|nr:uncharacterized protein LOC119107106 isoform X1 [Pollicipes pollicipes]